MARAEDVGTAVERRWQASLARRPRAALRPTRRRSGRARGAAAPPHPPLPSSRVDLAAAPPHTRRFGGGATDLAWMTVGGAVVGGSRLSAAADDEAGGHEARRLPLILHRLPPEQIWPPLRPTRVDPAAARRIWHRRRWEARWLSAIVSALLPTRRWAGAPFAPLSSRRGHHRLSLLPLCCPRLSRRPDLSCTRCQRRRPDRPELLSPCSLADEVTAACLHLLLCAVPAQVELDAARRRAAKLEEQLGRGQRLVAMATTLAFATPSKESRVSGDRRKKEEDGKK